MTEKTKVYFVGGVMAGKSLELPEPLPSIYEALPQPPENSPIWDEGSEKAVDVIVKKELYILHSLKRRVGSTPARVYIIQDLQFGGISEADLAHIPG